MIGGVTYRIDKRLVVAGSHSGSIRNCGCTSSNCRNGPKNSHPREFFSEPNCFYYSGWREEVPSPKMPNMQCNIYLAPHIPGPAVLAYCNRRPGTASPLTSKYGRTKAHKNPPASSGVAAPTYTRTSRLYTNGSAEATEGRPGHVKT